MRERAIATVFQETFTETRDITDSAGNTFTCEYSLVYDAARKVVYRTKSSVKCEPNTNGKQTVEDVVIEVDKQDLYRVSQKEGGFVL